MASHAVEPGAAPGRRALSLHIGLNAVSGAAYAGWTGPLVACDFDAKDMAAIARPMGIKPTVLLTKKATRKATLSGLRDAAATLRSGDLFFLSYSGHGGQVPDVTGDETDRKDETWCLYDGQLIDDELYLELRRFAAGVRILVVSDSCHSGTVTREPPPTSDVSANRRPRLMPEPVAMRAYREHADFYDQLQRDVSAAAGGRTVEPVAAVARAAIGGRRAMIAGTFKPKLLLIAGCQDNQVSLDGERNGAFTEQLLAVWNRDAFAGDYVAFHARIRARLPASQSPKLSTLGAAAHFLAQRPFTV